MVATRAVSNFIRYDVAHARAQSWPFGADRLYLDQIVAYRVGFLLVKSIVQYYQFRLRDDVYLSVHHSAAFGLWHFSRCLIRLTGAVRRACADVDTDPLGSSLVVNPLVGRLRIFRFCFVIMISLGCAYDYRLSCVSCQLCCAQPYCLQLCVQLAVRMLNFGTCVDGAEVT